MFSRVGRPPGVLCCAELSFRPPHWGGGAGTRRLVAAPAVPSPLFLERAPPPRPARCRGVATQEEASWSFDLRTLVGAGACWRSVLGSALGLTGLSLTCDPAAPFARPLTPADLHDIAPRAKKMSVRVWRLFLC